MDEIKTAGLRARNVVRQLLSFSRKSEQQKKPLQLASIINESLQLLRASIPADIEIQWDIADDTGRIKADPTQIQQVLINLCTNAAHAMEENGGHLKISLRQIFLDQPFEGATCTLPPGPYVQLTVSDTGKGIAPEIKPRIFDPYFTTKEVGKGSGLGLAIVHGVVMNHDGGISIHSAIGKGTRVTLLFPVCKEVYAEKEDTVGESPVGNERLLFIDDEASIVTVFSQMLQRLGYKVQGETNPEKAVALFASNPEKFDLIITDMTMPNMTGDQVAEKLKEIRSDIPVIVCTGFSQKLTKETVERIGIKGFLMKPVITAEMAQIIRKVLDEAKDGSHH